MKKVLFSLFLLCPTSWIHAQFPATFDQPDFTFAPFWQGDTSLFQIVDQALQLNDPAPGVRNETFLSVPARTSLDQATTWSFRLRLDFAPSLSNYARFYLSASTADLTTPLQGYFVRIGGITGADDALELYRQDGEEETLLATGTTGAVGNSPVTVYVVVRRDTDGTWILSADYSGGSDPVLEATAVDATYPTGTYAGLWCTYTATRSTAFTLDDVLVDPLTQDTIPPRLVRVEALAADRLTLTFNEPLAFDLIEADAFTLSPERTIQAWTAPAASQIELVLTPPLSNATTYQVTARNLVDLAGNVQPESSASFTYLRGLPPAPGQLRITEFLANPSTDLIRLPRAEYIELYNSSGEYLELNGVLLSSGARPEALPAYVLPPRSYLTLTGPEQADAFTSFGEVLAIPSFPTLSNAGDQIRLETPTQQLLEELTYDSRWFDTGAAADGRASLERIDLNAPADCPGNWTGSTATAGGTPGQPNAVEGTVLEQIPPTLMSVRPLSSVELAVQFNEGVNTAEAIDPANYQLSGEITILSVLPAEGEFILVLDRELASGTLYTLTVTRMSDCLGNQTDGPLQARFGLPELPGPGDLLINEVLFHPQVGGADFVELYNASAKIIELAGLLIRNEQKTSGNIQAPITAGWLMFPGDYVALTEDPADLRSRYPVPDTAVLLANDLPTLDADAGNVTLYLGNQVLDAFDYSKDLHNALLDNERGVSLERLSPMLPTADAGNWHSAAQQTGFATPGYRNSQFAPQRISGEAVFTLANRTFSPDGDSFEDILLLDYQTSRAGYLATIHIYDAEGRPVRTLARNELLAAEGRFKWDGSLDSGERARTGLYLLWIELFTPQGDKELIKEYCVLATAF